jgi:hypothetical protein
VTYTFQAGHAVSITVTRSSPKHQVSGTTDIIAVKIMMLFRVGVPDRRLAAFFLVPASAPPIAAAIRRARSVVPDRSATSASRLSPRDAWL